MPSALPPAPLLADNVIISESKTSDSASSDSIPTHHLGVKPLGNRYLSKGTDARLSAGTLGGLPDEMLMLLLEQLELASLQVLGASCRFLYAFTHSDELWKALFLTNIQLEQYAETIPKRNQIRRLSTISYDEFASKWTEGPFILTNCIQKWPVCSEWATEILLELYPSVEFRAEAVDWTLSRYCDYMADNRDESPLYLFDRKFAEKMDIQVGEQPGASYWRPECFGPDLFEVLGKERPAHRWLIVGPKRSGSTFHKDPNDTSAWNVVIQGAKDHVSPNRASTGRLRIQG
ncbi:hypothetical protein NLG97_g7051 [Lecanicillium saksenae]|uniref:Uncharacterized protein n=1 Tax=Lecanicillium saksenae TaxID=468837 RepID=A0ACC1QR36_9HYPO|nr:hypothetical protein NLG97_g7051 [Lecanicillium saksenae]